MEAREITIVSTKTQRKSVIMSSAETLSELKSDMRNAGIDYTNMTFYQGLTKTEIVSDDSLLPKDVNYKGTVTNNLVFMLTNPNKKITSGADRKAVYAKIKELHLEDACKSAYGKNYTQCSTECLETLIKNKEVKVTETTTTVTKEETSEPECNQRSAFDKLCDLLYKVLTENNIRIVTNEEVDMKEESVVTKKKESTYSSEDIDDMFNFLQ